MKRLPLVLSIMSAALAFLAACGPGVKQISEDQLNFQKKQQEDNLLQKTVFRPGSTAPYEKGTSGGTWQNNLNNDLKTFNPVVAVYDAESAGIVDNLSAGLLDYDPYKKQWKPLAASYDVAVNEASGTMDVTFTLRDDLYWTTLADPKTRVKVTSDDVVFWYNEVVGDPAFQHSAYAGQFVQMPDGKKKHIDIAKIDERRFVMHYPRIIAMPELSSNMNFGPRYVFEPVKKAKKVEGVLNLWTINTDPRTIPSFGPYYIESNRPGIQVTLARNQGYFKTDDYGQKIPYIQKYETKIVSNQETERLKFLAGELDGYSLRPEDLQGMVAKSPKDYTVYYAGPSLGSRYIAWNQNPRNLKPMYVKWFSNTTFRQAMSCFFNRDRVVKEVYRGLAEPDLYFFAKANPYFDPAIKQQYTYDPERGKKLLAEIDITPNAKGIMQDADGNPIAYDLMVPIETNITIDVATVYADELKKAGITLNVKPVQFQKIVESLTKGYDWQSVMIATGSNYFPIQGDNVWLSSGNLHLWNPLQPKPATAWEARVDELYWQGYSERDPVKAKKIWDEYQRIILDQVPVMYIAYEVGFAAYRDKWANIRVDTLGAPDSNYLYQKVQ
ncbi:MAG TPA: ABC transporter substrate-binding protein [Spirochaetia bacterium]|nr:ABC transporter substrate-binding protein [Spirochaetia bacterium]